MDKELRTELRQAVLLSRFRSTQPTRSHRKYISYKSIAAFVNLSVYEVQHICRKALLPTKAVTAKMRERILTWEHIDFLLSPKTLELWAGYTMKERVKYFHRRFLDKRIAITSLRRLYLKNKIKRKKVRQEKVMPTAARENFTENCRKALQAIE
jgi:hypothetical protein